MHITKGVRRALAILMILTIGAAGAFAAMKDGTYQAKAQGKKGEITVQVVIKADAISSVTVLTQQESVGISDGAFKTVPSAIVDGQTVTVDAVAGATETSNAIVAAVTDCIRQAGGDPARFAKKPAARAPEIQSEYAVDVVVVGGGASGCSAAVSAGDSGAKVVLIEKTNVLGGASLASWAGFGFDSKVSGVVADKATKEKFIQDWITDCHWRLDAAMLRRFVNETGNTYDWLAGKGWTFVCFPFAGGTTAHMLPDYGKRPQLFKDMTNQSVVKNGGTVLMNTTAQSLITDKKGAVVGVNAVTSSGKKVAVKAKAVIMATGGYSGNKEMVQKAFGFGGVNGGLEQDVGEGLKMAWAAGAAVPQNFGGQMLHQTLAKANKLTQFSAFENKYPMILTYVPSVLNVGASGARFRDETTTLVAVAAANTSAFQGPYHYVIVSKKTIDTLMAKGLAGINMDVSPGMPPEYKPKFELTTPWANAYAVFDAMVAGGWGFKGATLEELARNAGMDPATFTAAYASYEKQCAAGADAEFGKAAKYLVANGAEGPFYAVTAEINNLGSVGGLVVNTRFQVLNAKKLPVMGLYGVGTEALGVLFNDTYVGNGAGIAWTFTSGRLGGAEAAKAVLSK
jgi:uncharacterized protein with FMN-binding domain/predicted oxidoreductase